MKKYFVAPLAICVIAAQLAPLHVFAKSGGGGGGTGGGGVTPVQESCRRPVMVARRSIALKQVTAAQTLDNRIAQRDVQLIKAENFRNFKGSISNGGGGGYIEYCPPNQPITSIDCIQSTADSEQYARRETLFALSEAKQYEANASAPVLAAIQDLRDAVSAASSTRTAAITSLRATLFNGYDTGLVDRLDDINALKTTRLNAVNNAYTAWQARCANPSVPSEDPSFVSSVASAKYAYDGGIFDIRKTHLSSMSDAFKDYIQDLKTVTNTYVQAVVTARQALYCVATNGVEGCGGGGGGGGDIPK